MTGAEFADVEPGSGAELFVEMMADPTMLIGMGASLPLLGAAFGRKGKAAMRIQDQIAEGTGRLARKQRGGFASAAGGVSEGQRILANRLAKMGSRHVTPESRIARRIEDVRQNIGVHGEGQALPDPGHRDAAKRILQAVETPLMSVMAQDPVSRQLSRANVARVGQGLGIEEPVAKTLSDLIDISLAEHITEKVVGYGPGGLAKGLEGAETAGRSANQILHDMVQNDVRRLAAAEDTRAAGGTARASDIPSGSELQLMANEIKQLAIPSVGQEVLEEPRSFISLGRESRKPAGEVISTTGTGSTKLEVNPRTGRPWLRPSAQHGGALDITSHYQRGPGVAVTDRQAQTIVMYTAMGMSPEAIQKATIVPGLTSQMEKKIPVAYIKKIQKDYSAQIESLEGLRGVTPNPELEARIANTPMEFDKSRGDFVFPEELEDEIRNSHIESGFFGTPEELVDKLKEVEEIEKRAARAPSDAGYRQGATTGSADKWRHLFGEGILEGQVYTPEIRTPKDPITGTQDVLQPARDKRLRDLVEDGVLGVEEGVYYEKGTTAEFLKDVRGFDEAEGVHWISGQPLGVEATVNPEGFKLVEASEKAPGAFEVMKDGKREWVKRIPREVGAGAGKSNAGSLLKDLSNIAKGSVESGSLPIPSQAQRAAFSKKLSRVEAGNPQVDAALREETWSLVPKRESYVLQHPDGKTMRERAATMIVDDRLPPRIGADELAEMPAEQQALYKKDLTYSRTEVSAMQDFQSARPPFATYPGEEILPGATKSVGFDDVFGSVVKEINFVLKNGDANDLRALEESLKAKEFPLFMKDTKNGLAQRQIILEGGVPKEIGEHWVKAGLKHQIPGSDPRFAVVNPEWKAAQERLQDLAELKNQVTGELNSGLATMESKARAKGGSLETTVKATKPVEPLYKGMHAGYELRGSGQRTVAILETMSKKVDDTNRLRLDKLDQVEMSVLSDVMELKDAGSLEDAVINAQESLRSIEKLESPYPAWTSAAMGSGSVYEVKIMSGSQEALGRAQRITALTVTKAQEILKEAGQGVPTALSDSLQWMDPADIEKLAKTAEDVGASDEIKSLIYSHRSSVMEYGDAGLREPGPAQVIKPQGQAKVSWSGEDPNVLGTIGFSTHSAKPGEGAGMLFVDKADIHTVGLAEQPRIGTHSPEDIVAFRIIKEALDTKVDEIVFSSGSEASAERVGQLLQLNVQESERARVAASINMPPAFTKHHTSMGKMGTARVDWSNSRLFSEMGETRGLKEISYSAFDDMISEVFASMSRENDEIIDVALGVEKMSAPQTAAGEPIRDPIMRLVAQHGALNEGGDFASEGVLLGLHSLFRNGLEAKIEVSNRLHQAEAVLTRANLSKEEISSATRTVQELKLEAQKMGGPVSPHIGVHRQAVDIGWSPPEPRAADAVVSADEVARRERFHDPASREVDHVSGQGGERYLVPNAPSKEARRVLAVKGEVVGEQFSQFRNSFKKEYATTDDALEAARSIGIDVNNIRIHPSRKNVDDIAEIIYTVDPENAELLSKPASIVGLNEIDSEFNVLSDRLQGWHAEAANGEVQGFLHQGGRTWEEGDVFKIGDSKNPQRYVVVKIEELTPRQGIVEEMQLSGVVPEGEQAFSGWAEEMAREGKKVTKGDSHVTFRRIQDIHEPRPGTPVGGLERRVIQPLQRETRSRLRGKFSKPSLPSRARDIEIPAGMERPQHQDPMSIIEQAERVPEHEILASEAMQRERLREELGLGPEQYTLDPSQSGGMISSTEPTGYGGVHDPESGEAIRGAHEMADEEATSAFGGAIEEVSPQRAVKDIHEEVMYGEGSPEVRKMTKDIDDVFIEETIQSGKAQGKSTIEIENDIRDYLVQRESVLTEAQEIDAAQSALRSLEEGGESTGMDVGEYIHGMRLDPEGSVIRDPSVRGLSREETLPSGKASFARDVEVTTGLPPSAIQAQRRAEAFEPFAAAKSGPSMPESELELMRRSAETPEELAQLQAMEEAYSRKGSHAWQGDPGTPPFEKEGDIFTATGERMAPLSPEDFFQEMGIGRDRPRDVSSAGEMRAKWDESTPAQKWYATRKMVFAEALKKSESKVNTINAALSVRRPDSNLANQALKMETLFKDADRWRQGGLFTENELMAIDAMASTIAGAPSTTPSKVITMTPEAKKTAGNVWNKVGALLIATGMIRSETKKFEVAA